MRENKLGFRFRLRAAGGMTVYALSVPQPTHQKIRFLQPWV